MKLSRNVFFFFVLNTQSLICWKKKNKKKTMPYKTFLSTNSMYKILLFFPLFYKFIV